MLPPAASLLPQATAALLLLLSGNGGDDAAGLLDNRDCSDVPRNCVQELVGCLTVRTKHGFPAFILNKNSILFYLG